MTYGEFAATLSRGELKHVYLLAGEEDYYIKKARARILDLLNIDNTSVERLEGNVSPEDVIAADGSASFFADKTVVSVTSPAFLRGKKSAKDETEETAKADGDDKQTEGLIKFFAKIPPDSYIIFESPEKIDNRRRIVKAIGKYGAVLNAERIRAYNINDFLQGKLQEINRDLTPDAHAFFTEAVNFMQPISLSFLDKEFDKLALFAKERRITKAELAESFSGVPEVSNFAIADAVTRKDAATALKLLLRQINDGVFMPLVLGVIANQTRQLLRIKLLAKDKKTDADIAKTLGLHPFVAGKQKRAAAAFTEEELTTALLNLADADYRLKTGDGNDALITTITELCQRRT